MRTLIRWFDRLLRRAYGVFEFSADRDCILRLGLTHTTHAIVLPSHTVPRGAPVLILHLWNEHLPAIPANGPDVAWGVRMSRLLIRSFRAAAHYIQQDDHLRVADAVGGVTVLVFASEHTGGINLFGRLGFTVFPYHAWFGRFGEFWENLYTWAVMWAFNSASLRQRHLLRLRRTEIWMTMGEFLSRYGGHGRT